ncbi:MAG TPA: RNA 2',3'-cyclic phosphodiesterase [Candidatus Binataceae bacterium]|nr:RNA 2',3'-cyclic phosphodiesterase [Candidatus Binataceae bacterium]
MPDKIRAFVALRMSAEVEDSIARWIESLRGDRDGIRWVRTANLHLTLRFLGGAVDRNLIAPLDHALEQIAAGTAPFTLEARGAGVFPNLDRPRVVWVGLAGDALPRLAAQVEAAAVRCGFPREPRPYSPHLTIGRVRDLRGWPPIRDVLREASSREFGATPIARMMLYRSILGKTASQYVELAGYQFTATSEPT